MLVRKKARYGFSCQGVIPRIGRRRLCLDVKGVRPLLAHTLRCAVEMRLSGPADVADQEGEGRKKQC